MLQIAIVLILYAAVEGFAIPDVGSPRIGLSEHTLGAMQATLLLGLGLMWPRLTLGLTGSRVAFWSLIYSVAAILTADSFAAVWGVGNETIVLMGELPHGLHHGSRVQETLIRALAYSFAPTGLIGFTTILWGLRKAAVRRAVRSGAVDQTDNDLSARMQRS